MKGVLSDDAVAPVLDRLGEANAGVDAWWSGEPTTRQPLHTVYGGAHLFRAGVAGKLGAAARRHLDRHAGTWRAFAAALELPESELIHTAYDRMRAKLEREPVEDFRIDFEDGFGHRPDPEEDATAVRAAQELARGAREGILPPFTGIRVKPMTEELKGRAVRTTDLFVSTLLAGGELPAGFVITLPKVECPAQVAAFVELLELLEQAHGLPAGALEIEIMIEVPQALLDRRGRSNLPLLLEAADGRCRGAHFGTYDYTASTHITAAHQRMDHPVCDFAKHLMQVAYANTGVMLSDGATNVMPVGPHASDDPTEEQRRENDAVVHAAWRTSWDHITHSLRGGYYQGWDLHPGQLPIRFAASFAFFLEEIEGATARLANFVEQAAQATRVGEVFDDAATGQGLLNTFLRALNSGAITEREVAATGLTVDELRARSFKRIIEARREGAT